MTLRVVGVSVPSDGLVITVGAGFESSSWSPPELVSREERYTLRTLSMSEGMDYASYPSDAGLMTLGSPGGVDESAGISLKELIFSSLKELGVPVLYVDIRFGEGVGLYALAVLDCDARRALEYWLEVVDRIREHGVPLFVMWTGSVDVAPEEMGAYIGRVLARMNVFLATRRPIDVVRILREEWGL